MELELIKTKFLLCLKGNHELEEIQIKTVAPGGFEEDHIVKWCTICGSVVVDRGADGRSNHPGGVMVMKSPGLAHLRMVEEKVK